MKSTRVTSIVILLAVIGFIIPSCHKGKKVTNVSSAGSSKSHNRGQNCMNCHKSGGEGAEGGWFQAAGTVYDSLQNNTVSSGNVYFYTGPNGKGTVKYTLQVDALGNFYTTNAMDFGTGLYPAIQGQTLTKHMVSSITTGQCNSCHGVTTGKIWVK